MSVCAVVVDKNKIWLGTDGLTTRGPYLQRNMGKKYLKYKGLYFLSCGQVRFKDILHHIIRSCPKEHPLRLNTKRDVCELVAVFQKLVDEAGIGHAEENELPMHSHEHLIVNAEKFKIWKVSCDYAVQEYKDFVAIGSGGVLAEPALDALYRHKVRGKTALKTALQVACDGDQYCGGRLYITEATK